MSKIYIIALFILMISMPMSAMDGGLGKNLLSLKTGLTHINLHIQKLYKKLSLLKIALKKEDTLQEMQRKTEKLSFRVEQDGFREIDSDVRNLYANKSEEEKLTYIESYVRNLLSVSKSKLVLQSRLEGLITILMPLKDFYPGLITLNYKDQAVMASAQNEPIWPGSANLKGPWKQTDQEAKEKSDNIQSYFEFTSGVLAGIRIEIQDAFKKRNIGIRELLGMKHAADFVINNIDKKYENFKPEKTVDLTKKYENLMQYSTFKNQDDLTEQCEYIAIGNAGDYILQANGYENYVEQLISVIKKQIQDGDKIDENLRKAYFEMRKNLEESSGSLVAGYILLRCNYYEPAFLTWITNAILYYRGQRKEFDKISCSIVYLLKEKIEKDLFDDAQIAAITGALNGYSYKGALEIKAEIGDKDKDVNTGLYFIDASFDPFGMEIKNNLLALIRAKELQESVDRILSKPIDILPSAKEKINQLQEERISEKEKEDLARLEELKRIEETRKKAIAENNQQELAKIQAEQKRIQKKQEVADRVIIDSVQEEAGVSVKPKQRSIPSFTLIEKQLTRALQICIDQNRNFVEIMKNKTMMNPQPELDFFDWINELCAIQVDSAKKAAFEKYDKDQKIFKCTQEMLINVMQNNKSIEKLSTAMNDNSTQTLLNATADVWKVLEIKNDDIKNKNLLCYYIMIRNGVKEQIVIQETLNLLNTAKNIKNKYINQKLIMLIVLFEKSGFYEKSLVDYINELLKTLNNARAKIENARKEIFDSAI